MMDQEQLDAGNALSEDHIALVQQIMGHAIDEFQKRMELTYRMIVDLTGRAEVHDVSKLEAPEAEIFAEFGPKLKGTTYDPTPGSVYQQFLTEMKVALDHHYGANSHHPEHFPDKEDGSPHGVNAMTLLDVLEMLCDWKAATMRHEDGDIAKSIEINTKRFGLSPQLAQIFKNTLPLMNFAASNPLERDAGASIVDEAKKLTE